MRERAVDAALAIHSPGHASDPSRSKVAFLDRALGGDGRERSRSRASSLSALAAQAHSKHQSLFSRWSEVLAFNSSAVLDNDDAGDRRRVRSTQPASRRPSAHRPSTLPTYLPTYIHTYVNTYRYGQHTSQPREFFLSPLLSTTILGRTTWWFPPSRGKGGVDPHALFSAPSPKRASATATNRPSRTASSAGNDGSNRLLRWPCGKNDKTMPLFGRTGLLERSHVLVFGCAAYI